MSKSLEQINKEQPLAMIHFDYDKYFVREDAKSVLDRNAAWLKKFRTVKILVEGHCDERGTEEYNLALGEKRAKSAIDYLVSLGDLRRPDEDPLLRQEPASRRRPRRGVLAEEPARPVHHHRKIARDQKSGRGHVFCSSCPSGPPARRQDQESLRAHLRRRPGPQEAGPGHRRPARKERRGHPARHGNSSTSSARSSGGRRPTRPASKRT